MVIRRGLRSIFVTLALYLVSGAAVAYFMFHAQHGARAAQAGLVQALAEGGGIQVGHGLQ